MVGAIYVLESLLVIAGRGANCDICYINIDHNTPFV